MEIWRYIVTYRFNDDSDYDKRRKVFLDHLKNTYSTYDDFNTTSTIVFEADNQIREIFSGIINKMNEEGVPFHQDDAISVFALQYDYIENFIYTFTIKLENGKFIIDEVFDSWFNLVK